MNNTARTIIVVGLLVTALAVWALALRELFSSPPQGNFSYALFKAAAPSALMLPRSDGPATAGEKTAKPGAAAQDSKEVSQDAGAILNEMIELASNKGRQRVLVLFQNNFELRPTGGYLGSFAVLEVEKTKIRNFKTYDSVVFDASSSYFEQPPTQLKRELGIRQWKFRDSNWNPSFPDSVKDILRFYHKEGGKGGIDAVVAVDSVVFETLLDRLGGLKLPSYGLNLSGGTKSIVELERLVEINFQKLGLSRKQRKDILQPLGELMLSKLEEVSGNEQHREELLQSALDLLTKKHILIYFEDQQLQDLAEKARFAGRLPDPDTPSFVLVDANMNSLKTDIAVRRSVKLDIDYSAQTPLLKATVKYENLGLQPSWLIRDYTSFTRIFLPRDSKILSAEGFIPNSYKISSDREGRLIVSGRIKVRLRSSSEVTVSFQLPDRNPAAREKKFLLVKQPGLSAISYDVSIKAPRPIASFSPQEKGFWKQADIVKFQHALARDMYLTVKW